MIETGDVVISGAYIDLHRASSTKTQVSIIITSFLPFSVSIGASPKKDALNI